jgi:transcriptional regulator with XRE-family HTH domain
VNTSPNSSARKVQEALGLRLRNLRKDAGLTGRELAAATGWHFTRISKLEHGAQAPTDRDIRAWCAACGAGDQAADLIAQARAIESMYVEFRRRARSGVKQLMDLVGRQWLMLLEGATVLADHHGLGRSAATGRLCCGARAAPRPGKCDSGHWIFVLSPCQAAVA